MGKKDHKNKNSQSSSPERKVKKDKSKKDLHNQRDKHIASPEKKIKRSSSKQFNKKQDDNYEVDEQSSSREREKKSKKSKKHDSKMEIKIRQEDKKLKRNKGSSDIDSDQQSQERKLKKNKKKDRDRDRDVSGAYQKKKEDNVKENIKDKKKDKVRDRESVDQKQKKDREKNKEREREIREKEILRVREREIEREREIQRENELEEMREREKERDREQELEREREREREREQNEIQFQLAQLLERQRQLEKENAMHKNIQDQKQQERQKKVKKQKEKNGNKDKEKERGKKPKDREKEKEREREKPKDTEREKKVNQEKQKEKFKEQDQDQDVDADENVQKLNEDQKKRREQSEKEKKLEKPNKKKDKIKDRSRKERRGEISKSSSKSRKKSNKRDKESVKRSSSKYQEKNLRKTKMKKSRSRSQSNSQSQKQQLQFQENHEKIGQKKSLEKNGANDEVRKQEMERRQRLARARARILLKCQISDDEDDIENDNKPLNTESQQNVKTESLLVEGDQFTEQQKQRVREREERKQQEKCRQIGKRLLMDSDGLEADEDESESIKNNNEKNNNNNNKKQQQIFAEDDGNEDVEISQAQQTTKPSLLKSISSLRLLKMKGSKGRNNKRQYSIPPNTHQAIDEEDPLEAFMKSMECRIMREPMKEITEKVMEQEEQQQQEQQQQEQKLNMITFEEIMGNNQLEQQSSSSNEDIQEQKFHQDFLKEFRQLEQIQRIKENEERLEQEDIDDELDIIVQKDMEEDNDYLARQRKLQEKKELKPVDHDSIEYIPFRKNFYHEVPEISRQTDEQVEQLRQELGNIKVRGRDISNPINNWYQCGLNDRTLQVLISKKKFLEPFPIQAQAIPCLMSGRDFIGIAETGSGKTLAYILPLIRHVLDQPALQEGDGPIGLIMAPTRELAHQIYSEFRAFTNVLSLNIVCCVGGAGIAGQLSELKRGAEIVVCTPGRMIDVLTTSNGKVTNLRRVTFVIIDEADRMFDLGFEPQIYRILNNVRPDKQLVMFSATFPKNVEQLSKKSLQRPIECVIGGRGHAGSNILQQIEFMEDHDRLYRLLVILQEWNDKGSILIFVDKQSEGDALFKELIKYGYRCLLLHGGIDAQDREFTIHDFKKEIKPIMVATSVCARGLDIRSIVLVVNFQCPNHMEDYIHRIGRTGRAGQRGTAITFFTPQDEQYAGDLITCLERSGQVVPQQLKDAQKSFNEKVGRGEAKVFHNRNRSGTGFKFNEQEKEHMKQTRAAIRKQLGIETNDLKLQEDSTDDDEFFSKVSRVNKMSDDERKKLHEEKEKAERERIMELIKDPTLKAQILSEATKAANACINSGGSKEQVAQTAIDAMKRVLKNFLQANRTVEGGIEEAIQIINEFEERERIANDFVSYDFEINDYPSKARTKICSRDFLDMIRELSNCTILQRGIYFEPSKKVPQGQRKQFLRIEGESEFYVLSAYKEIKRVAEDLATQEIQKQVQGKFQI